MRKAVLCAVLNAVSSVAVLLVAASSIVQAEDWPEYRGAGRTGVWKETGIVETGPAEGLKVLWRTPVNRGFSGPSVAAGRVFLTDFERDYEKMNATYRSYFKPGHLPARTCIGVTALARGGKLEIDFICKRPATAKRKAAKRATRRR